MQLKIQNRTQEPANKILWLHYQSPKCSFRNCLHLDKLTVKKKSNWENYKKYPLFIVTFLANVKATAI